MLKSKEFWVDENQSPLMLLNKGFLDTEEGRTLALERALKWPTLFKDLEVEKLSLEKDPDPLSIIVKDAERTFSKESQRKILSRVLYHAHTEFGDYHQGLSFVTSFLMLFLDHATVVSIIRRLNESERYLAGYWKHQAIIFARDAYVFDALLKKHHPTVHAHLAKTFILPETYLQKWFTALGIHVLEFSALFRFFELFFERGFKFLLQFGLAFFEKLGEKITSTTNPATIYAYLRMDRTMVEIEEEMAHDILDIVNNFELSEIDLDEELQKMREIAYDENLKQRFENKANLSLFSDEEEDDEDEEGLECQICEYMVPEVYCVPCKKYICGMCNNGEKDGHKKEHRLLEIEDVPSYLSEQLEKLSIKEKEKELA